MAGEACATQWTKVKFIFSLVLLTTIWHISGPRACTHCKSKKQDCQYSPRKHACQQCIGSGLASDCVPAASKSCSWSTSAPPPNVQDTSEVTQAKPQKHRPHKSSTMGSTPQSPDQSQHVKHQHQSTSQSCSGSESTLLATTGKSLPRPPPPQATSNALEAIQEDEYEYLNYSPPDLMPYQLNLPATQASKLLSMITGSQSDIEMDINENKSEVEEYSDLNLINNGDSDSNGSNLGESDKIECHVQAALAQTRKSQEMGIAKEKKQILTQLPSMKTMLQSRGSESYDPEMCCRSQPLSWYTILTLSFWPAFMIQCTVCWDSTNSPFTIPSQISLPDLHTTVVEKLNFFPDYIILQY